MKNRAKCKLCSDVIQSFHRHDFVTCKCGEISVDGGDNYFRALAKNWENFLRLDDNDNIITPTIVDNKYKVDIPQEDNKETETPPKPTYEEKLEMLRMTIQTYENAPNQMLYSPVTHSDLASALLIILSLLEDN